MSLNSPENIIKVLAAFNPWWRTGLLRPEFSRTYKRFAYYEAIKHLDHPTIRRSVILTGTRRVGKTTIQYQLIEMLLARGTDPKRIVYVSLDHPLLKMCKLNEILDCYHDNFYGGQDVFYFFDEVQYASDWDQWIKIIYDSNPLSRVVATGSASPVLVQKASESGAGRWVVLQVPTLSFYEYCELLEVPERPQLSGNIRPTALHDFDKRSLTDLFTGLAGLQKHFSRYLVVGGFPELALANDDFMAQRMLREDVVDKVLKRDIPSLYKIRNVNELERIFLYLCYYLSNIISVDAIAKELGNISRATVEGYIQFMESANLIYRSYPVELGGKKILKAKAKIYIADPAIRNAVLMQDDIFASPEEMGIMAETAVYKHVAAFYYQVTTSVGYYRGGKSGNEIDIVVDFPTGRIFIEVKYRENASIGPKDALYTLADQAVAAIVITKKDSDFGLQDSAGKQKILRIPAYAFLYLLGNAEKHGYKGDRSN